MDNRVDIHDMAGLFVEASRGLHIGEEVTIVDAGRPVAKLVAIDDASNALGFEIFTGQIAMGDGFKAPLLHPQF